MTLYNETLLYYPLITKIVLKKQIFYCSLVYFIIILTGDKSILKIETEPSSEREENIDTIEQMQTSEEKMEDITSQKSNKKIKRTHGEAYSCDQCEFAGSRTGLYLHKKSKHDGVRHPCDKCEYSATTLSDLKRHKKSKHERVRYPCDQCEHAATQMSDLNKHKKRKHSFTSLERLKFRAILPKPYIMEPVYVETWNIIKKDSDINKQVEHCDDPLIITQEPIENNVPKNVLSVNIKQETDLGELESKGDVLK